MHEEPARGASLVKGFPAPIPATSESPSACSACGAGGVRIFYRVRDVPAHSCLMMSSREEALAFPRGDI